MNPIVGFIYSKVLGGTTATEAQPDISQKILYAEQLQYVEKVKVRQARLILGCSILLIAGSIITLIIFKSKKTVKNG